MLLSRSLRPAPARPVKVLQIGAGNFARAFTAFALQMLNNKGLGNAGIVIATSSPDKGSNLNSQGGLYTVVEASKEGRNDVLMDLVQEQFSIPDNFQKFLDTAKNLGINLITSNTTEVGIVYKEEGFSEKAESFPARLTLWLHTRFQSLQEKHAQEEDLFILPCELLEKNGSLLKEYVEKHARHWALSSDFFRWMDARVKFMNTLVDRIVPGFPDKYIGEFQKKWGYEDRFAVLAEKFFFLAVQGDTKALEQAYPFSKIPLDIAYTDDLEFYRLRKVSFLNGAHTSLLGLSMLAGFTTVQETLKNPQAAAFLKTYLDEACLALGGNAETKKFIEDVCARFVNPYLEHKWADILLNALSKFSVRNIPVMLAQEKKGLSPAKGLRALAALVLLYQQGIQKDALFPVFQKLPQGEGFAEALLSDKDIFPAAIPSKKWGPLLASLIDELKAGRIFE